MRKKLIAFDLDDTLAVTKSPMTSDMASRITRLLEAYDVCVITAGTYGQIVRCVVDLLPPDAAMERLHLLPLNGAFHYRLSDDGTWQHERYIADLTTDERSMIATAIESAAKELGLWEQNPAGDIIEDRGSQLTFSALGQQARAEDKYAWDPDGSKRTKLRELVLQKIPDYEVRINGNTSIDVTKQGFDKGYGMAKLLDQLKFDISDVLFVGDQLHETGNDYPIKQLGVETISVRNCDETADVIDDILGTHEQENKEHIYA